MRTVLNQTGTNCTGRWRGFAIGFATAAAMGGLALGVAGAVGAQQTKPPINTAFKSTVPDGHSLLLVFSNTPADKVVEYNAFYARHIGDIMRLPGFVSAKRFVMTPRPGVPDPKFHYLALYEMKGDPNVVLKELTPAVKAGHLEAPNEVLMPEKDSGVWTAIPQAGPPAR